MATFKEIADRKHKLLDRFRSELLEEVLETERANASVERDNERFAWKGEFRSRDEINHLYSERKRWDRRFLVDTFVLGLLLLAVVAVSPRLMTIAAPKSNYRDYDGRPTQQEQVAPATEKVPAPSSEDAAGK